MAKEVKGRTKANHMHDGHRDRVRERFAKTGFDGMASHEIIEMLLFYSVPRKDTNEIAHRLIKQFGSLAGVFEANLEELQKVKGVTFNSAVLIKMMLPLYHEYVIDVNRSLKLTGPDEIGKFLVQYYQPLLTEQIMILCTDASCKVLGYKVVSEGDIGSVSVDCRKILETVLRYSKTVAVILAHNHPGGLALPSREDIETTHELVKTLERMGVKMIDHIIVAGDEYVSMASSKSFMGIFRNE